MILETPFAYKCDCIMLNGIRYEVYVIELKHISLSNFPHMVNLYFVVKFTFCPWAQAENSQCIPSCSRGMQEHRRDLRKCVHHPNL